MPNKMLWYTEHIAYIPMVQKSSVCTWQTCKIECYCNPNIYPVSSGFKKVSLHMSNMPNKTCGSGPLLCMAGYSSHQVKAEHESKCHNWICVGFNHQVTQSHMSKTCGSLVRIPSILC